MTFLALPASASHWKVAITDAGGSNATFKGDSFEWIPPSDGNNTNTFDLYAASTITDPNDTDDVLSSATVNATITLTWVADPASDPPPPSVYIVETASASAAACSAGATATASDGLTGDIYQQDPSLLPDQDAGTMATPGGLPGGGRLTSKPVKGGSVTFNRNLMASGSSQFSFLDFFPDYQSAEVSYTISIHAQPYNMVLSSYTDPSGNSHPAVDIDNVNGILTFHYSISSTDGVLADLASISAYETLDWSSNPGNYAPNQYLPPSPPVQLDPGPPLARCAYKNPDREAMPYLTQGYAIDRFSPPATGFAAPLPFPSTVWKATQNYLFDDSQTGQVGVKIPGPDNKSPFTITRTVTPTNLAGTTGTYSVTTRGATASASL